MTAATEPVGVSKSFPDLFRGGFKDPALVPNTFFKNFVHSYLTINKNYHIFLKMIQFTLEWVLFSDGRISCAVQILTTRALIFD